MPPHERDKPFDIPGKYFVGSRRVTFAEYTEHTAKGLLNVPPIPDIKMSLQLLTPESAKAILDQNNIGNREVDAAQVAKIAKDMRDRRYLFTGQSIILSGDKLLDAQHRLLAVILADTPQWFIIVVGVDNEAQKVIDATNKVRTLGDISKLLGQGLSTQLINAIAFANANFDRKKVTKLSNTERAELSLAVSQELVQCFQNVASAAHVGQIGNRAVLAACYQELQNLERRGLNSLVAELADWLVAALRNEHGNDQTSNDLFNKLRNKRKCPRGAVRAQANDYSIQRCIAKACAAHLQAQDERLNGRKVAVG